MIVVSVDIPVIFYIAVVVIALAVTVVSAVIALFAVLLSLLLSFSLFLFVNILHLIFHALNFIVHKRFRELHANISSKIFLNICVALGAALPVWMVLEVYTMYFAFVKFLPKAALDAKIPRISICCLICWGE